MRIVFISDSHLHGGAAIAATRLAWALKSRGHEVIRFVGCAEGADLNPVHEFAPRPGRIRRLASRVGIGEPAGFTRLAPETVAQINALRPDWISLHNIHGQGLRVDFIRDLTAPVLWTLHDMWSFTGRCAYDAGCPKYTSHCDSACPAPEEYPSLSPRLISVAHEEKRRLLRECPHLHAVTPSEWMRTRAVRGGWDADRVTTIHNTLDLDVFKPIDKNIAKRALGLPDNRPVIGCGAMNPDDPRKGGPVLVETLNRQAAREATILTFGSRPLPLMRESPYVHLGTIESEKLLALFYSACDLFLHPSDQDNFPNTVCESMSCGTPVFASYDSGAAEIIEDSVSGWLTKSCESSALITGINKLLDSPSTLSAAGKSARDRIVDKIPPNKISMEYLDVAREIHFQ